MTVDTELAHGLAAWLHDTVDPVPVPPQLLSKVAREIAATPQRRGWPRRSPLLPLRRRSRAMSLVRAIPIIAAATVTVSVVAWTVRPGPAGTPPGGVPSLSAGASIAPGPSIDWDTGRVRLSASAMRIGEGDRVFTGDTPEVDLYSDGFDRPTTFEATWWEQGVEQRLFLYFDFFGTEWQVTELRTFDGDACLPEWIYYAGPLFTTPLGEAFQGDVRLSDGHGRVRDGVQVIGSLEFDGLTLERREVPQPSPTATPRPSGSPAPSVTPGVEPTCGP